jgi:hypothetical protein
MPRARASDHDLDIAVLRPYLMAFWMRFCSTCTISSRSPRMRAGAESRVSDTVVLAASATGSSDWHT